MKLMKKNELPEALKKFIIKNNDIIQKYGLKITLQSWENVLSYMKFSDEKDKEFIIEIKNDGTIRVREITGKEALKMKNDFNTDDINIDIFRNEFKRYIKCGLTVDEAIKKFNDNNCFILNGYGFEAYRSLRGTIELEYVHYVGSITTNREIESIRKDTKLKELYKKREECEKQISDLTNEMIEINYEINKAEANK